MEHSACFSSDYATARGRFLDAAQAAGAAIESVGAPTAGPDGAPLFIDEAHLGSTQADRAVVVSSGLHGVEGFAGSAVQLAWLRTCCRDTVPASVRVILVHGLNPYGFAWLRRGNEHNVDLNRNFLGDRSFLDDPAYVEARRVYDRLCPFLNPASAPARFELYRLTAARWALTVGLARLQRTLPVGQYHRPRGLFYGGDAAEWTTTTLRRRLRDWTKGTRLAIHLDVHSGLGRWGRCQLLTSEAPGSARAAWALRQFGPRVVTGGARGSYRAHGTMTDDFQMRARPCEYYGFTMEFGTYSSIRVLGALRAENRAHHFAAPDSDVAMRCRRQLLEAFVPRSPAWRTEIVEDGLAVIGRAIGACHDARPT